MRWLLHSALRALTSESLAEAIVGDLEELRRRGGNGRIGRAVRFWRAACAILLYVAARRARSVVRRCASEPSSFMVDVRYAIRTLSAARWYTTTVIAVIALGFALSTTVFAVVDGVLFKPLPYRNADELYLAFARDSTNARRGAIRHSPKDVRDWAEAIPDARFAMFEILGDISTFGVVNGRRVGVAMIDAEFLDVLGVRPLLGGFGSADFIVSSIGPFADRVSGGAPAAETIAVLITHRFWQQFFGGDVAAPGRTFHAPDVPQLTFRVAGVLPADFVFPSDGESPDLLLPLAVPSTAYGRRIPAVRPLARFPATTPLAEIQARLDAAMRSARAEYHASWTFDSVRLTPVKEELGRRSARTFALVFAATGGLALIACVNVAGLATARARSRRQAFALRRALGASGWDLTRLVLAEALLLVAVGAAVGLALSHLALASVIRQLPQGMPLYKEPAIDGRVFGFVLLLLILATLGIGLATARTAAGVRRFAAMGRETVGSTARAALSRSLVVVQVAVTLVLTLGGALFVASLSRALGEDFGFQLDRTLALTVHLGAGPRRPFNTVHLDALVAALRRQAGVQDVGVLDSPLLTRANSTPPVEWPAHAKHVRAEGLSVGASFFDVAAPPLIEGRYPTATELDGGRRVAVVSEGVASAFWPGMPAVGRTLQGAAWSGRTDTFEVVGVVGNARVRAVDLDSDGQIYLPVAVSGVGREPILLVRAAPGAPGLEGSLIQAVAALGSPYSLQRIEPLEARLRDSVRIRVFQASLFGTFAVSALVLVGVGVVGLLAMAVAQRRREVAIRIAIGSSRFAVLRLLMHEQLAGVTAGLAAGAVLAFWCARLVASQLYEVAVYDPTLWSAAIGTVLATAVIGVFLPAWRASRLDPLHALREE